MLFKSVSHDVIRCPLPIGDTPMKTTRLRTLFTLHCVCRILLPFGQERTRQASARMSGGTKVSTGCRLCRRLAALILIMAGALSAGVTAQRAADRVPLPYDLAFAHKEFPWQGDPAVSLDGAWVAYSVIQPIATDRAARYQPNGTPSSAMGSRIFLQRLSDNNAPVREICPKSGNCWRPAWSPDSRRMRS